MFFLIFLPSLIGLHLFAAILAYKGRQENFKKWVPQHMFSKNISAAEETFKTCILWKGFETEELVRM